MERVAPKIIFLRELLSMPLTIPPYQRPYRWTTDSALTLLKDLYNAYITNVPEYRIGTVVLHPEEKVWEEGDEPKLKYNIVDGQQRVTTLSILMHCFYIKDKGLERYKNLSKLLDEKKVFKDLSHKAICDNFETLSEKLSEISEEKLENFLDFILDRCSIVKIETNKEQEAFQFFDSQNSRGKELAPHDLLKSYHLREMNEEKESLKVSIINAWESTDQKNLAKFFYNSLFPLVSWYKGNNGLYYSSKKIKIFKGLNQSNNYHFSVYHKAANLYIEHFNDEGMYELTSEKKLSQFQLTQPIIAGKRFFLYVLYYYSLKIEIEKRYLTNTSLAIPEYGSGNLYIKNLFLNALLFFIDKFGYGALTDFRLKKIYKWCYSLRLVMHSVYPETINKYALGKHERLNLGKNLFTIISDIQSPDEFDSIIFQKIDKNQIKYTDKVLETMSNIVGIQ